MSEAARPIRCSKCKATSDEHEFGFTLPVKVTGDGVVHGVTADGKVVVDWMQAGHPSRYYRPELVCGACGHIWTTTRDWVSDNEPVI